MALGSPPLPLDARAPAAPAWDEARLPSGEPRPHYRELLAALEGADLARLRRQVASDLSARGVSFGSGPEAEPFVVDPVPRIVTAAEWEHLAAGLTQRVRALNAFLDDVHDKRRAVTDGVVPERVVETAEHLDPVVAGLPSQHPAAAVAGLDVVRGADGRFMVLEDNLRTPSGLGYAIAARAVLEERLPLALPERQPLVESVEALGEALRAAAPGGRPDPSVALVSDGPSSSAWFEHDLLARSLGIPLVTLANLEQRGGRLLIRTGTGSPRLVDVLYRRTNEDRLTDESGRPTPLAEAVLPALRAGRLAVVNGFGNGVGDDKLVHAYVEDMVRFYLGEEPLLPSVHTFDLGRPDHLAEALDRIDDLVVKPRTGHGGEGIVVCPHATPEDRRAIAARVRAEPERWVAQETVMLSSHPTVVASRLEPRHVDLRPFVLCAGDGVRAAPGGLTRVALAAGALVVNSSQRGGGKDTWVLE